MFDDLQIPQIPTYLQPNFFLMQLPNISFRRLEKKNRMQRLQMMAEQIRGAANLDIKS